MSDDHTDFDGWTQAQAAALRAKARAVEQVLDEDFWPEEAL